MEERSDEAISTYTYDKLYQLTKADYPVNFAFADTSYNYDKLGNHTSTVNGGTTTYTSNSLNQYTKVNTTTYSYDKNGNLTNDGTNTYSYDYENRLIRAAHPGGVGAYIYDPFGRRIQTKETRNQITETRNYIYDGDQMIMETDATGTTTAKYIYGPGIDEPICIETRNQSTETRYYYNFDGLGSVTQITDDRGQITETYEYDVFGKPTIKGASGFTLQASSISNPYMFTGREYDVETGLYYYRARYYSPTLGRLLQRDPIGYWGGINLYTYCNNDPVNWIDPFGLDKQQKNKPWWEKLEDTLVPPAYGEEPEEKPKSTPLDPRPKDPTPFEPTKKIPVPDEFTRKARWWEWVIWWIWRFPYNWYTSPGTPDVGPVPPTHRDWPGLRRTRPEDLIT